MNTSTRIGIIICDRYRRCAGGKCLKALKNRQGAFSIYETAPELVGYTTCDGCPGGNIEYAANEMIANGAEVIHLATGMVVGYPPCPYITTFKDFLEKRFNVKVVFGTHPIPQKYLNMHSKMSCWNSPEWQEIIKTTMTDEITRLEYD